MKCSFALLMSDEIHNYIRKKAIKINQLSKCGLFASQFIPHISLKQPCKIEDIDKTTFDLSAKNPNTPEEAPLRQPNEILKEMAELY